MGRGAIRKCAKMRSGRQGPISEVRRSSRAVCAAMMCTHRVKQTVTSAITRIDSGKSLTSAASSMNWLRLRDFPFFTAPSSSSSSSSSESPRPSSSSSSSSFSSSSSSSFSSSSSSASSSPSEPPASSAFSFTSSTTSSFASSFSLSESASSSTSSSATWSFLDTALVNLPVPVTRTILN